MLSNLYLDVKCDKNVDKCYNLNLEKLKNTNV